jgi:hypothetical protein
VSNPPELFVLEQVFTVFNNSNAVEDYKLQKEAEDPIAFAASQSDPDALHYNQAMQANNDAEFKAERVKEADDHTTRGHWVFWEKMNVPEGQDILSAIWAFKLGKCQISTWAIYKHRPVSISMVVSRPMASIIGRPTRQLSIGSLSAVCDLLLTHLPVAHKANRLCLGIVEGNGIHATQVSSQDTAVLLHYP